MSPDIYELILFPAFVDFTFYVAFPSALFRNQVFVEYQNAIKVSSLGQIVILLNLNIYLISVYTI